MRFSTVILAALLPLLVAACGGHRDADQPVTVSAIGGHPSFGNPATNADDLPSRLLMSATAQGLVQLDAAGQVEPALAERWIVIDDGLTYIFRLNDVEWSDGKPVTAAQVETILRRALDRRGHNPLTPFMGAIHQIVAMTPEVIEINLDRSRPDLLRLLAQPPLGIFRMNPPGGSGPFSIERRIGPDAVMLRPRSPPLDDDSDKDAKPDPARDVELIGERAARAIVRFVNQRADVVTGGSFVDWPLVGPSGVSPSMIVRDPAVGLFGLAIVDRKGFLSDRENRTAIAEAIDRDAALAGIVPDWPSRAALLPAQLDSAAMPTIPDWATRSLEDRRIAARKVVAAWRADHDGERPVLRIALPDGPGATLLYGSIGASLISIGIEPQRVALDDRDADLRLVDQVAPVDSAGWYFSTACHSCGDDAAAAITAAQQAQDGAARAAAIAAADAALTRDAAFITLGQPLRWSLVAPIIDQWQPNAQATHPLNHLRTPPT